MAAPTAAEAAAGPPRKRRRCEGLRGCLAPLHDIVTSTHSEDQLRRVVEGLEPFEDPEGNANALYRTGQPADRAAAEALLRAARQWDKRQGAVAHIREWHLYEYRRLGAEGYAAQQRGDGTGSRAWHDKHWPELLPELDELAGALKGDVLQKMLFSVGPAAQPSRSAPSSAGEQQCDGGQQSSSARGTSAGGAGRGAPSGGGRRGSGGGGERRPPPGPTPPPSPAGVGAAATAHRESATEFAARINTAMQQRHRHKQAKEYASADMLRDQLRKEFVTIQEGAHRWKHDSGLYQQYNVATPPNRLIFLSVPNPEDFADAWSQWHETAAFRRCPGCEHPVKDADAACLFCGYVPQLGDAPPRPRELGIGTNEAIAKSRRARRFAAANEAEECPGGRGGPPAPRSASTSPPPSISRPRGPPTA